MTKAFTSWTERNPWRALRRARCENSYEFAKSLGVPRTTAVSWERGGKVRSFKRVAKVLKRIGFDDTETMQFWRDLERHRSERPQ